MRARKRSETPVRGHASGARSVNRAGTGSFFAVAPGGPRLQRAPLGAQPGVAQWFSGEIDIDDPKVQAHLRSLSRGTLLKLLKWVREPRARTFIEQLAVPENVATYDTGGGVSLDRTRIEELAKPSTWGGYWAQKIATNYELQPVPGRLMADRRERDLVLASLWKVRPRVVSRRQTKRVSVGVSQTGKKGPRKRIVVHYRFDFLPPAPGKKPSLKLSFEREVPGDQYGAAFPGPGYESFKPSSHKPDVERGFPGKTGTSTTYWAKRKQEHKKLFYWIERRMKGDFHDQEVTANGVAYKVTALKEKGKLFYLEVERLGSNYRKSVSPYLDPEKRDVLDLRLEELRDPATKKGALGDVILEGVPADELFSVKYAIWQNFAAGLRNRELDIVIPIASTRRRVFYTLRIRPNRDVDVERLGEEGSSAAFSPGKTSIQRAHGYPAAETDVAVHRKWLKKRYKALKATGSSPQELRENADKELTARVKKPDWLKDNYSMPVLDATKANARLWNPHKIPKPARAGLKEFTGDELVHIETGLQPMSDGFVRKLRWVHLLRQKELLANDGKPVPEKDQAGAQTLYWGNKHTIRFFDRWRPQRERFFGGASGIRAGQTQTVVHEFGHVLEQKLRLRKAFNKLVAKEGAKPFTDYAAAKPGTELFPEALAAYELDPEWLKANHPVIYAWIDKRAGK